MRNKRFEHISNIMSKRYGTFTLLQKSLSSFFQVQEKQETCLKLNLRNSRRSSFTDNII